MTHRTVALALLGTLMGGCYEEGLPIFDLVGTLTVSEAAATRTFVRTEETGVDAAGDPIIVETSETVTDVRLIGPVYVGLYSGLSTAIEAYPHPERGPQFETGVEGDTYPYGGTTIGDFRYACMEFLTCKLVSGRFSDFDEIVDWFNTTLSTPVTDAFGDPIETGEYLRQTCYDLLRVTTDEEVRITGAVQFEQDEATGNFVGEFDILQAEFYDGMTAWAFMDTPSSVSATYSTCDPDSGRTENTYNRDFEAGLQYRDVLNNPAQYLGDGDWVGSAGYVWTDPDDDAVLSIDFEVGVDDIASIVTPEDGGAE